MPSVADTFASVPVGMPPSSPEQSAAATAKKTMAKRDSAAAAEGAAALPKKRSKMACLVCRKRKVSCDIQKTREKGRPCSRCVSSNVKCELAPSKRGRRNTTGRACEPRPSHYAGSPYEPAAMDSGDSPDHESASPWEMDAVPQMPPSLCEVDPALAPVPHGFDWSGLMSQAAGQNHQAQSLSALLQSFNPQLAPAVDVAAPMLPLAKSLFQPVTGDVPRATGPIESEYDEPAPCKLSEAEYHDFFGHLPTFLKRFPDDATPKSLAFLWCLRQSKCFWMPQPPLRDALIKAFVEHIYPSMPIVDLASFLNGVYGPADGGEQQHGRISFFLFQAVMFSASPFVDQKLVQAEGFQNKRAFRRELYEKAELFHKSQLETDRLAIVQGSQLLTFWYKNPDALYDMGFWMSEARRISHTIGLHQDPARLAISEREKRLRRRIWACLCTRDALMVMGTRRGLHVREDEMSRMDDCSLDDFDFEVVADDPTREMLPTCDLIRDPQMQRQLAEMFLQIVKLCGFITRTVRACYSLSQRPGVRPSDTEQSTLMLLPDMQLQQQSSHENAADIAAALRLWPQGLPESCRARAVAAGEAAPLAVQRSVLHMTHSAAVIHLYRPMWELARQNSRLRDLPDTVAAYAELQQAAANIAERASELQEHHLARFLPAMSVTFLLHATGILHNIQSGPTAPGPLERRLAQFHHQRCWDVLEQLREAYVSADFGVRYLEVARQRQDLLAAQLGGVVAAVAAAAAATAAKEATTTATTTSSHDASPSGQGSGGVGGVNEPSTPPPDGFESTAEHDLLTLRVGLPQSFGGGGGHGSSAPLNTIPSPTETNADTPPGQYPVDLAIYDNAIFDLVDWSGDQ